VRSEGSSRVLDLDYFCSWKIRVRAQTWLSNSEQTESFLEPNDELKNHYNRLYDDKGEPMVEELTVIVLTGIESLLLVRGYGGV